MTQEHESGFLRVESAQLWCDVVGDGPYVVVLPSGDALTDSRAWDAQASYLAGSRTVVRYDDRGYGRSSVPTEPYSRSRDAVAVIRALNVKEAALMSEHGGAQTALETALALGPVVNELVLISPSVVGLPLPVEYHEVDENEIVRQGAEAALALFPHLDEAFTSGDFSHHVDDVIDQMEELGPTERARVRDMFLHNAPNLVPDRFLLNRQQKGTTPDWGTALREISARTLVIVSRAANGDGPHVDFLLEKLPNATKAVLPRGNFSIALEDPEELNAVLGNFLRGFP